MAERDEFDRMLDAALATYANPDSGLEERILARVEGSEPVRSQRPLWLWTGGFAIAAASLLLFILPSLRRRSLPPQAAPPAHADFAQAPTARTVNSAPERPASRLYQASRRRVLPAPPAPPKLAAFPAPAPLSPAEEALVRVVAQSTEDQRRSLLAERQELDTPIHISAISIPPISPPAEGQE